MKKFKLLLLLFVCAIGAPQGASARLEVCNHSDLILMVVVGYDTADKRTATEGWWKIYPGFCETPIDLAMLDGNYYVHAESDVRSTMPVDNFQWGSDKQMCVKRPDFRIPDGTQCEEGDFVVGFSRLAKNWRNSNVEHIRSPNRRYKNEFTTSVAGLQRMLSLLGLDVGDIDGVMGLKTVNILRDLQRTYKVEALDFKAVYMLLEKLIAEQQKLNIDRK